jgi:hypothetical protein
MRRYIFKYDACRKYEKRNALNFSALHNRDRKAINERNPSYADELHMGGCFENMFYLLQFISDETNRCLLWLTALGI